MRRRSPSWSPRSPAVQPVDVLVLNATGSQPEAPVTEVAWAGHPAQLNFFVKSPVLLGRAVLPAMQARRYGRIVHIDSEVAHWPGTPADIAHAASFLPSEGTGFITGQRIVVDGGRSLGS
jgi:3-oxoacyl-[acyl-carrier protein] reductase